MQGIIEEQRISRRRTRPTRRSRSLSSSHAAADRTPDLNRYWANEDSWLNTGSVAPKVAEADPVDDSPAGPFQPGDTSRQKVSSRRSRGRWMRRLARPARRQAAAIARRHGVLAWLPTAYLAPLFAVPAALIALAVIMNTVIGARALVVDGLGVQMPAEAASVLVAATVADSGHLDGEPLGFDPTTFEAIRKTDYTVVSGDTISEIAERFGLDARTLMSVNSVSDVRRLLPGTVLSVPDRDGSLHIVMPGESLSGIATQYDIRVSDLLDANDISSSVLEVGATLFIPGVLMPWDDFLEAIGELFGWPVRSYTFTSDFGMRIHPISGVWHMHTGVDLANRVGTPILAAGAGTVVHVEEQVGNYGKMIIIDHQNGYRTLYGHLNEFWVSEGQYVGAGQQIGTMGSTGRSTGSHLHFSVLRGSTPVDPESQLR